LYGMRDKLDGPLKAFGTGEGRECPERMTHAPDTCLTLSSSSISPCFSLLLPHFLILITFSSFLSFSFISAGAEKDKLKAMITSAEDWLYTDGFDSTKQQYGEPHPALPCLPLSPPTSCPALHCTVLSLLALCHLFSHFLHALIISSYSRLTISSCPLPPFLLSLFLLRSLCSP
jgi:hypothetical protein